MSELRLDVGTANELKLGMRVARAADGSGWTDADVKNLTDSVFLGKVLSVLRNQAEIVMKKAKGVVRPLQTITTPAIAGKKTADCFINKSRDYYRRPNLDAWLPEYQPDQVDSKFSVQKLTHQATFKQAVESFLGMTDKVSVLAAELKKRGHVTALTVVEYLIGRQEAGEDVGLRTDGWANFFFVEDKEGSVSVVGAFRDGGGWYVLVSWLDSDVVWDADYRFFFRI